MPGVDKIISLGKCGSHMNVLHQLCGKPPNITVRGRASAVAAARTQISRALPARTEAVKEVTALETVTTMPKQEVCWMRDPKTGCWAPEDSFDLVDVAELRAQVLSMQK